jgi:hypothetical protein
VSQRWNEWSADAASNFRKRARERA